MEAFIVGGYRSAVGKAPKGVFKSLRPDDLASQVIQRLMSDFPQINKETIDDVIVGNATPEAEQGLNVGRMISLMGLNTEKVPGMTVNRYCSSGIETIAIAHAKIQSGMAHCIIAGGVECMSPIPFGGWRIVPNARVAKEHPDWYWGMGLTAEAVAKEFNVNREDQDLFAFQSHQKAIQAIENGHLLQRIAPVQVEEIYLDENEKRQVKTFSVAEDEGPRKDTSIDALARLKPVFAQDGVITAGNSSQTSDGAAFVLVCSEQFMKENDLTPIAQLKSYAVAALSPRIMGVGPIYAVSEALKRANLKLNDIDYFELNEAFASQSLAVMRELNLDPMQVNIHGGAIALGHPLGCTGAKLTIQLINELNQNNKKYGIVTMCVGTGQGAAAIIEKL
ncbi:MAG: thiolase family protein [Bacteroidota bacterium]